MRSTLVWLVIFWGTNFCRKEAQIRRGGGGGGGGGASLGAPLIAGLEYGMEQ